MSQMIILKDVDAKAGPSTPRIVMSAADQVARYMPHLIHAVSPSELMADALEGLKGRCRCTSKELQMLGAHKSFLSVITRSG